MKTSLLILMSLALSAPGAFANSSAAASYPTLAKLCGAIMAANPNGPTSLMLGEAVISPEEVWTLNMNCEYLGYPQSVFQGISLSVNHSIVNGPSEIEETLQGLGRLEQKTTNGKPELDLVFISPSQDGGSPLVKIGIRDFMRLNGQGQPINTTDHFDGTLDPSEVAQGSQNPGDYVSGIYLETNAAYSLRSCQEKLGGGWDAPSDCNNAAQVSKTGIVVGDRNSNPISTELGWLYLKYPTNTHLNSEGSRVDFRAALKELGQALGSSSVSDQDFQSTISSTESALSKAFND